MIHLFIILNLFFASLVCSVIPVCESYIINFVIFLLLFMGLIVFFGIIHESYWYYFSYLLALSIVLLVKKI